MSLIPVKMKKESLKEAVAFVLLASFVLSLAALFSSTLVMIWLDWRSWIYGLANKVLLTSILTACASLVGIGILSFKD